jgi:hypothetical protein
VSNEYREKLLDAFDSSVMTGQQFADHCGVKRTTFATWVQKRRRKLNSYPDLHPSTPKNILLSLAEVELAPAKASAEELSIELPGGARMILNHPEQASLAAALIYNLSNKNNAQL